MFTCDRVLSDYNIAINESITLKIDVPNCYHV